MVEDSDPAAKSGPVALTAALPPCPGGHGPDAPGSIEFMHTIDALNAFFFSKRMRYCRKRTTICLMR